MRFLKKERLSPLYAAALTAVLYLLILAFSGILGYGNLTILSGDLYQQYIAFIHSFLDSLLGKRDFWYSFSLFYGSGTVSTYAYYCFSPFNLLYLLPFSDSAITIAVICCKLSLAAACFQLFLRTISKTGSVVTILFACAYALSSFALGFQINIMWLDALYILPVLMLLLIRFVNGASFLPLIAAYAYLFLTNFYMGYIVGIFSALFLLALLVYKMPAFNKAELLSSVKKGLLFALSVLLSAGCCAALLLPAAAELLQSSSERSSFNLLTLTIPDVLNNFFLGEMQSMGSPIPLLYCGLPALFLLPLYFNAKQIEKKEKIISGILLLFYLATSLFLPLYSFVHVFEAPNWFAHRYAFCVVFLMLTLCARALPEAKEQSVKSAGICLAVLLLFYSLMIPFQSLRLGSYQINSQNGLLLNAAFLCAYFLCFLAYRKEKAPRFCRIALAVLLCAELVINGCLVLSANNFGFLSEEQIRADQSDEEDAVNDLRCADPGFYRIRIDTEHCYNSPSAYHFAGLNSFASADNAKLRATLTSLGIAAPFANIYDQGYTDLSDMLFGVKYEVSLNAASAASIKAKEYALPIGFMVSDALLSYQASEDPFQNQEKLLSAMCGKEYSFYEPLSVDEFYTEGRNMEIRDLDGNTLYQHLSDLPVNGKVFYEYTHSDSRSLYACFLNGGEATLNQQTPQIKGMTSAFALPNYMSVPSIVKAAPLRENVSNLELEFSAGPCFDYLIRRPLFYLYDDSRLSEVYTELNSQPLVLTEWTDSSLSGNVTATEEKPILFTSIPYSEGWQLYVDDQPARAGVTVDGTFLSVYLTPGPHTIRLVYEAPGAGMGMMISAVCVIISLLLLLKQSKKKSNAPGKKDSSQIQD